MRPSRLLTAAVLLCTALAPLPGRAATVRSVDVKNVEFEPRGIGAVAGDTITWTWRSGSHSVTAYQGATFDQQISSGPFSTFSHQYAGGLLLYYCKIHSSIAESGECLGPMCGRVSDTPPTVRPPEFRYPANNSTVSDHMFQVGGIVDAGVAQVRVKEGQATLGVTSVQNQSWAQWITLSNGTHTVTAIAIDQDGFESARSAPLTVTVNSPDDFEPPVVGITAPKDLAVFNPLAIAGDAIDYDSNIAEVTITVTDVLGAPQETDWVCGDCGTKKNIHFVAYAFVAPGLYKITVRAVDAAGHAGSASKDVVVVR